MGLTMSKSASYSFFEELGFDQTIEEVLKEIQNIYLSDEIPWVIGYSGGKDSTVVLQLVWYAIKDLPREKVTKPVHVICTDTLVENPIVAIWVENSLKKMGEQAKIDNLPIIPHLLTPEITNTFWVSLIGKGYPAPRNKFRWCTDRLKIKPANKFVLDVVKKNGEVIMLLGMRKAESSTRAAVMKKYENKQVRDKLNPSGTLPNCLVYPPISEWANDDVWMYLMQVKNPWGYNNKDLLTMYQGATEDGECPLVVDKSTPSCGSSRFGCWICTLVEEDKSMTAMIQNDYEKEWMLPLLDFRNEIDFRGDKWDVDQSRRDFRRMNGNVQLYGENTVKGPYTQESRAYFLRKILEIHKFIKEHAPDEMKNYNVISLDELKEIRRLWVTDKHEFEDTLPVIYKEVIGVDFPDNSMQENVSFDRSDMDDLKEICDSNIQFELIRELLDVEKSYATSLRRAGLFDQIEKAFKRNFFDDMEDAKSRAKDREQVKRAINEKDVEALSQIILS